MNQREVLRLVVSTEAEGMGMVELQVVSSGAPPSVLVAVRTPSPVARLHESSHRRGDVAGLRPCVHLGQLLPRLRRLCEAPGLQALQLPLNGQAHNLPQVSVRYRGAHQGLESFQLVAKPFIEVELQTESTSGDRLRGTGWLQAAARWSLRSV